MASPADRNSRIKLRPYYVSPTIGAPQDVNSAPTSAPIPPATKNHATPSYASSARDIFSDIDYADYVPETSQSTLNTIKALLDQALYKYLSILLAQPFENAKTILQVQDQSLAGGPASATATTPARGRRSLSEKSSYPDQYASDDSDPDEVAYFTSAAPSITSYSPLQPRTRNIAEGSDYDAPAETSGFAPHQLQLKRTDSVMEVLGQLWTKEGAWGIWKCSNATFIYSILLKTTETWSRSFIAALINMPDPASLAGIGVGGDVIDSPYPWTSLAITVGAAAVAGILLAPLDLVRTKLILTSTSSSNRSYVQNTRSLSSYVCSPRLFVPTLLHSISSPLNAHMIPLVLRSRLGIDASRTPSTYSFATFVSATVELFLRLPVETVLRRGQAQILSSPAYADRSKLWEPIVTPGQFRGTFATMWLIAREEGHSLGLSRPNQRGKNFEKRGQGVEGLWRAWRVGMWGLVGIWGAAAIGGSGSGGEF